jgi:hypothetical protein
MQVHTGAVVAIEGWDHERLSVDAETNVGEKAGIENGGDCCGIVRPTIWESA